MANLLFVQTSGGHDVLWFQERLGGSATNSDSSDHHATLCIAAYGFLVAERSRFSPSARAGQVDLPVPEMPLKFRPRGSPGTRGAA